MRKHAVKKSILGLLIAAGTVTPAAAQIVAPPTAAKAPAAAKPSPSESTVINLINLLVEQGILTKDKAAALIQQARDEAAEATRKAAAEKTAPVVTASTAGTLTGGAASGGAAVAEPAGAGVVRVPYIPEVVRKQIEADIKKDVLKTAQAENWASPSALPEWIRRIRLNGDFRFRYEVNRLDKSNFTQFVDTNAFNSGNPIDVSNTANIPFLNTTVDRDRVRLRARLGVEADVTDDFNVGLRLSTGNTNNPVSTNQTLGTSFSSYNLVLDRAYLQYKPFESTTLTVGRMNRPWMSTELVWAESLGFDGIAANYQYTGLGSVTPFVTAGVFPIENTAFNFPSTAVSSSKVSSRNKWLYGAQIGADWKVDPDVRVKAAAAYYHFQNIEGVQAPCTVTNNNDPCRTDNTRPAFTQFGNSTMFLRSPITSTGIQPEYIGLASQFREFNLTTQFDFATSSTHHLVLDGDFVANLAFDRNKILSKSPAFAPTGNLGFLVGASFGTEDVRERWDWRIGANYRYIESDALVDAFNDPDFHLGGTNAKGFMVYGRLGVAKGVSLQAKIQSTSEVGGAPFSATVFQTDLNAKF